MDYYVNLPLSWVLKNSRWLEWFIAEGLSPELGLDEEALTQPVSWHEKLACALRDAGIECAAHLPFWGLSPADSVPDERERAARLLHKAAGLAAVYGFRHMVGHPGYDPARHGIGGTGGTETTGRTPRPEWLDLAVAFWRDMPERGSCPLFLENTYDTGPDMLRSLMEGLGAGLKSNMSAPDTGICFDVGHWHAFYGGRTLEDLEGWVDAFAPWLRHVHLHDNDGAEDQHLGLGQGTILLEGYVASLKRRALRPSVTYEPHTVDAFAGTAVWYRAHPDAAAWLHWAEPSGCGGTPPPLC